MNTHSMSLASAPVPRAGWLIPALLFFGLWCMSSEIVRAQVDTALVDDNFDTLVNPGTGLRNSNGQYSTAPKASTWWYVNTTSGTTPLSTSAVAAPAEGNFSGNAISVNFRATNNVAISTFAATTLGVGDSLTVSFDYYFAGALTTSNRDPQFGLFNGTAPTADVANGGTIPTVSSGYQVDLGMGTNASRINKGFFAPFAGAETRIGDAVNLSSNFTQGEANHFSLVITRTAESSVTASFYLDGASTPTLTGIDTAATNFTFNEFIFRGRSDGEIDNFKVTYTSVIPEASMFGLLAASAGLVFAMVCRRRSAA